MPPSAAGGYHPVKVGETYGGRYTVLQKLGWGHFSTVWLVQDARTGQHAALKVNPALLQIRLGHIQNQRFSFECCIYM